MLGLQPVLRPLPDRRRAGGGGAHEIVLVAQPAGHAVVQHHTVVGAHHAVANAADLQLGPLVDVEQVEQLRYVGSAQVQLADRGDVDDADVLPDVPHLGPAGTAPV